MSGLGGLCSLRSGDARLAFGLLGSFSGKLFGRRLRLAFDLARFHGRNVREFHAHGKRALRTFTHARVALNAAEMDKMGEKSAQNLINALEKSKTNPLYRLINAFGIRHIGEKAAKILSAKYKTLDNLRNASVEELTEIADIGGKMAHSVVGLFMQEK